MFLFIKYINYIIFYLYIFIKKLIFLFFIKLIIMYYTTDKILNLFINNIDLNKNYTINKLIKLLNKILDDEDNKLTNSKSKKLIYEEPIIFRKND